MKSMQWCQSFENISVKDNYKNLSVFQRWRFNYNMATFANLERGETAPSLALMDSESSVKVLKFVFSTCWGTLIIFINITSLQMAGSLIMDHCGWYYQKDTDYIVTFDWVLQLMLIQTHNEDDTEEKTIDDDDADKMPGHKSFACFPRGRAG